MPIATLLLRESTSASLTSIVEKSQRQKPPLPEYDLQVHSCQLDLILTTPPSAIIIKSTSSDEGFESDIDSLSIVSSDDSFTTNAIENPSKPTTETDSANGSACSDSDETDSTSAKTVIDVPVSSTTTTTIASNPVHTLTNESHNLVNCICYADVKFPDLLVFVIKKEALVFKFNNLENLQKFYTTFNTFKAIANQKAYGGKNVKAKFNLLQRTDNNGVTHIEISREPHGNILLPDNYEPTSIISINTPDNYIDERILSKMNMKLVFNEFRENNKGINSQKESVFRDLNRPSQNKKSSSTENILESEPILRKVWNSSENLLDSAKKPERRRKLKGKAPPPPVEQNQNVLKGEYVRVCVPKFDLMTLEKTTSPAHKSFTNLGIPAPKLTTYQQFKSAEAKKPATDTATLTTNRNKLNLESWTSSVPRLLKSQRVRGEGRNFTPMAYRYIDTTQMISNSPIYNRRYPPMVPNNAQISNRLFGMSSKLKDFSAVQNGGKVDNVVEVKNDGRWSSLGELSHKINNADNSLKSVIKKDENKRKNEKKVTFSAYTTVQVV